MNDRLRHAGNKATSRFTINPAQALANEITPSGKRKMLSINLPADLHQAFRVACVQRDVPMSSVITQLITTQLDEWNTHD